MKIALRGKKARGRVVLIDDEDYGLISSYVWFCWEVERPGRRSNGPYAFANIRQGDQWGTIRMHKLLTGWDRTDHVDGNGLNNQRSNLRPATRGQNVQNSRPRLGSSSLYKGVYWNKERRRWVASIRMSGRLYSLGRFTEEIDAAKAYDAAARHYFGEYARLNFS
jgi:AP2 domain-containing protein